MSRPENPTPARPFASFFFVDKEKLNGALAQLDKSMGERCFTSEAQPFVRTDYYKREMGEGIHRIFAAWIKLVDPCDLVKFKLEAWEIEEKFQRDTAGRMVNIDPGLIEEGRLTLATGKPAHHRPYLGQGVYADLTLIFERKSFRPLPWTYPDYGEPEVVEMLNKLRAQYIKDLRGQASDCPCLAKMGEVK